MAVSANPLVRDLQNGVAFAFKPFEVAIEGVANGVGSIGAAITEIDRIRVENQALRAENERLQTENRAAAEARRENDALTSLLQLRQGLDFKTLSTVVIARESSEARRAVVIDRDLLGQLLLRLLDVDERIARVVEDAEVAVDAYVDARRL